MTSTLGDALIRYRADIEQLVKEKRVVTTVEQSLVNLDQLKRDIAEARSIGDIERLKEYRDKSETLREYGKKHGWLLEDQNNAAEATVRCARAMGELLEETVQPGNPQLSHRATNNTSHREVKLSDIGITRSDSSRCQAIASLPAETFEHHIAEVQDKRKELTQASVPTLVKRQDLEIKKAERDAQAQAA